jgi:hypothetical protein
VAIVILPNTGVVMRPLLHDVQGVQDIHGSYLTHAQIRHVGAMSSERAEAIVHAAESELSSIQVEQANIIN